MPQAGRYLGGDPFNLISWALFEALGGYGSSPSIYPAALGTENISPDLQKAPRPQK